MKNKTLVNGRTYCEWDQRRSGNGSNVKIKLEAAYSAVSQIDQHSDVADREANNLLKVRATIKRSAKYTAEKRKHHHIC